MKTAEDNRESADASTHQYPVVVQRLPDQLDRRMLRSPDRDHQVRDRSLNSFRNDRTGIALVCRKISAKPAVEGCRIMGRIQKEKGELPGESSPFSGGGERFFSLDFSRFCDASSRSGRPDQAAFRSVPKVAMEGRLMLDPGPPRGG